MEAIALHAIGGPHWIGGVHYVVNLARALHAMPAEERPALYLVESPDGDLGMYDEIRSITRRVSWPGRLRTLQPRHLAGRLRGKPAVETLDGDLRERGVAAVFPVKSRRMAGLRTPWIAWLVDFQHLHHPAFFTADYIGEREELYRWLLQHGRLTAVSSHCALRDCETAFPGHRERLRVLRFRTVPAAEWYEDDPHSVARRLGLPAQFLIAPNQFFAHKNHECLFRAAAVLRDRGRDVHVVCTGQPEDFRDPGLVPRLRELIRATGMESRIHVVGLLPRREQVQLLRAAAAVVQPSFFEGWSTVVEDARALGKKLVLSDLPVHREQDPPGATFFDPRSAKGLADAIDRRWDELTPGPVAEDEGSARRAQHALVEEYARAFLAMVGEITQRC